MKTFEIEFTDDEFAEFKAFHISEGHIQEDIENVSFIRKMIEYHEGYPVSVREITT